MSEPAAAPPPGWLAPAVCAAGAALAAAALSSSLPAHHWWGRVALGGYTLAFATWALPATRRHWWRVALAACGIAPLVLLVAARARGWHHVAQSEVDVLEAGARRLIERSTPYQRIADMAPNDATSNYSYFPYLPALAAPGLPRAVLGTHWFTDARLWLVLVDAIAVRLAWRRLSPRGRGALAILLASPMVTLVLAAGGHDLLIASSLLLGYLGVELALAAAAACSVLAWPLVVPALAVRGIRWQAAGRVAGVAAIACLPVLVDPLAAYENVVAFPAGRTPARSPADAPSLGRALTALPGGTLWVALVLTSIVVALLVSLVRRPPRDLSSAAARGAIAFVCLVLAVPSSRAGYLIHPAVLGVVAVARGRRARVVDVVRPARDGPGR